MQLYLAVSPGSGCPARGVLPAHVAYRIGPESALLSSGEVRGGLLSLSDREAPPIHDPEALARAVVRECSRCGFSGAVLDAEGPPRQDLKEAAAAMGRLLPRSGRLLYVPEALAVPGAVPLLCTAISGGSLRQHLTELSRRYGGKFALDVQRLRMDFPLPCPTGQGRPLSVEEFRALRQQFPSPVFFSPELVCSYFTYVREGSWHLVLFDDRESLAQKLRLGASLGSSAAFFMWPEVSDLST